MTTENFTNYFNGSQPYPQNLIQQLEEKSAKDNFCKQLVDYSDQSKTEWPQLISNICEKAFDSPKEADLVISNLINRISVLETNKENSKSLSIKISNYIESFSFFKSDAANLKTASLRESFKAALESAQSQLLESTTLMLLRRMDPLDAYLEIVTMRLKSPETVKFQQVEEELKLKIPAEIQKLLEKAAQINVKKEKIKPNTTKEELMKLAPFLTYVNLENYSFETWTSKEVNHLVSNCKNTTYLNIHSEKLKNIPSLPLCIFLDCKDCENLIAIDALPKCTDLKCNNCPKLNSLPKLPNCKTFDCSSCSKLTSLPVLPECITLNCYFAGN